MKLSQTDRNQRLVSVVKTFIEEGNFVVSFIKIEKYKVMPQPLEK